MFLYGVLTKMEDIIQPEPSEPLALPEQPMVAQATATIKRSENLIQSNKRFSLLMQIFNWQPTGTLLRLNLPIENTTNAPLFGLRISPDWMNARFMMQDAIGSRYNRYLARKCWTIPWSARSGSPSDIEIGSGVTVIENDDMPDIAIFNCAAFGWKGSINYQLRCISNVTTQGKLIFTRSFDVFQPSVNYDCTKQRTVFPNLFNSQTHRRKNAFMVGDLSRASDFEIQCPYMNKLPFVENTPFDSANVTGEIPEMSYIFLDVIGALAASAGATDCIFEIWIQAGPDFEYVWPLAFPNDLTNRGRYRETDGAPWIFGQGTNLVVTDGDVIGLA